MIHERKNSRGNFDWKDCLRKEANSKDRLSHQFSIKEGFGPSGLAARMRNSSLVHMGPRESIKVGIHDCQKREKRGRSTMDSESSEERISREIFNPKKEPERTSIRDAGFFKVTKKETGQKSSREGYLKFTENSVHRQKPSLRFSETSLIQANTNPKLEPIMRKTHQSNDRVDDDENKENIKSTVNKELQDIKKCLETMKSTHNSIKEKHKPSKKVSQNPVLRLRQNEASLDPQVQAKISVSRTEPDSTSQDTSRHLGKTEPSADHQEAFLAYAAVSDVGTSRSYNEDRVCVIEKIIRQTDAPSSFFAVFDGHGGSGCADYLRDQLYTLVVKNAHFKNNVAAAFKDAIEAAEAIFCEKAKKDRDWSGSCLAALVIKENKIVVANVGDSRIILITKHSEFQLTEDHKPEFQEERKRIIDHGGKVYRNKIDNIIETIDHKGIIFTSKKETQIGPYRVEPGGLSVSRAIGDVKAKDRTYGGNPRCLISTPTIKELSHNHHDEFLILACDGIFDVLSNDEIATLSKASLKACHYKAYSVVQSCERVAKDIIEKAKDKGSKDNLTVIFVLFKPLYYFV